MNIGVEVVVMQELSRSSSASCLSTSNYSGRHLTQTAEAEEMGAYTAILVLGLLGTIQRSVTETNITSNSTTVGVTANERFRRLIPYMTFYFAQQNYDNQPVYQEYRDAAHVLPVSNNKLSAVPKYQGNLVVPASYLLRYTPRNPPQHSPVVYPNVMQQTANARIKQLTPRPFSPSSNGNNLNKPQNNYGYLDPLPSQSYQIQPIQDYVRPNVQQPLNTYDGARSLTVSQILNILQAIRKLPQTVSPNNREQTTAQLLNILKQTNQLPTSTLNSLATILSQIPRYNKVYQSLGFSGAQSSQTEALNERPKLVIYTNTNHPAITKSFIQTYANKNYESRIPQISTPVKDLTQNIEEYDTYDDEPKPQQPQQLQAVTRPLPSIPKQTFLQAPTIAPVSSIAQNINELQNFDYRSEVLDNPDNESNRQPVTQVSSNNNYPIKKPQTSTSIPDITQNGAELHTYGYAAKLPQLLPNYYRGRTTTQIFPAPNAEGGTPGHPGVDYPTYSRIPETSFTCKNQRYKGFFGDPETSCQVWHYCDLNGGQASFLCPNGTIFSQVGLTCDWWFNVRCSSTPQLYVLNERLYKYILPVAPSFPEDFSGPLVDQYLALKYKELENKRKSKENSNKTEPAIPSQI